MWKNLEVDGKKIYKTFEHWDGRNKKTGCIIYSQHLILNHCLFNAVCGIIPKVTVNC